MPDRPTVTRYRDRVLACWLGKAIGGALGQSFEGLHGPIEVDYYYPKPDGMVPNDDLDVQVAYAAALSAQDVPRLDRHLVAEVWRRHLRFPWNEYGIAKRNLAEGLAPPYTGSVDNFFSCGEGAVIRTELWACIAPGEPERAAAYAYEDACFDHAGDGIWAAVFMAALQSQAFVDADPDRLLEKACSLLPVSSRIRQVVHDTRVWVAEGHDWRHVMRLIIDKYDTGDFTDTRMNTGFVVLGWLASDGDFEKAILVTNGCGADTDSTTASLGALMAIADPDTLPERWLAPIGRDLILHADVVGLEPPDTIDAFTDQVTELRSTLDGVWPEAREAPAPNPARYAIPVTVGWTSPYGTVWGQRDLSGLRPEGSDEPSMPAGSRNLTVPGTWVRWPRDEFDDLIMVIRYTLHLDRPVDGKLMINCSEHLRVWLDGDYAFGSQPSQVMPTQHRPPAGQSIDVSLTAGVHTLLATIGKPPPNRAQAEWIVALAEAPGYEWIPHAFRPVPTP
ncbi:ADP-ribosylglycohydrolase family protein [Jiangella asiatica]|uniref:ADP-ribosylglycohydrolase family protein n=1 Tax=Jiangella asiatica TaxID=2530372 RepID=A0A4R5DR77_9ACTN|nr:ADP-ribosylglycohydrolase family protein [Jiangella asiatica]TDE13545.1 ADP-ribosylglycohydrolase family protein [Jiangella asiatica]